MITTQLTQQFFCAQQMNCALEDLSFSVVTDDNALVAAACRALIYSQVLMKPIDSHHCRNS